MKEKGETSIGAKNSFENLVHIASNMSQEFQRLKQDESRHPQRSSYGPEFENQSQSPTPSINSTGYVKDSGSNTPSNLASSPSNQHSQLQQTERQGKAKRMACVECRQQKSRCDAHERHPEPCTRCAKKKLKCDLKSDYKRTYKRARIAQIEKEFMELKKSLNTAQATELLSRFPSLANGENKDGDGDFNLVDSPRNSTPQQEITADRKVHDNSVSSHPTEARPPSYPQSTNVRNVSIVNVPQVCQNTQADAANAHPNVPQLTYDAKLGNSSVSRLSQGLKLSDEVLHCEDKSVESITLTSSTIKELFMEYVSRYHPIFPVVEVTKGPERIYRLCPPLFWVIIFVSLRRFKEGFSKNLLIQLSPIVKGILAEIMISPITRYNPTEEDEPIYNVSSVYSVQAFLLYSYWPPITSSLSADSSYSTVSTGFFQAIRIGLHAPSLFSSGKNSDSQSASKITQQQQMLQEQIKTWIATNAASQFIATAFGYPACVQFDSSIWYYSRKGSDVPIPEDIKLMLATAQFEDQMAKSLNSNPMDPCGVSDANERVSLLKLLEKRVDELEVTISRTTSHDSFKFRMFEILASKVHLFSYYFMDSSKISEFELKTGLVKLYNAATRLVSFTQSCQTEDKKFIKYLPGVYLLNLWQAACIIGKLVHSSLKSVIDVTRGKQSYEAVVNLTARASILKHDMAFRSSGITRNMWSLFRQLDSQNLNTLSISIRNRMAASVFFDCLNLIREKAGMTNLRVKTDDRNPGPESHLEDGQEDNLQAEGDSDSEARKEISRKEKRSLSNEDDADQKARKIIRTIPLDPEPISAGATKRSTIFNIVNASTDSTPAVKGDCNTPDTNRYNQVPPPFATSAPAVDSTVLNGNQNTVTTPQFLPSVHSQSLQKDPMPNSNHEYPPFTSNTTYQQPQSTSTYYDSPLQSGLESLDLDRFDSDMLWRDVDSVMNDFGFHMG
ncbi:LEU3 [Candida theae]|uniref:LEU3 n=1 Tax=Candida theae TaxID=1198502 RepID=A0AAD5BHB9_9ASCO|nr:LEU3 [Candida theae]KAI5963354.1 LEU3 [Candida theae]